MDPALLAKAGLSLAAIAAWAVLARRRAGTASGSSASFELVLLWAGTRLVPFVLVFVVLDLDLWSDVTRFYLPQGVAALDGQLVYRDFVSSYGPLFPYLAALPIAAWPAPAALVLQAIAWEFVALMAWSAVVRRSAEAGRLGDIQRLYLCNPLALVNVVLVGQNQIWVCALWGVAAWLLLARGPAWSGAAAALSVVGVKLLGALALSALWWRAGLAWRFAAGAAAMTLAGVVPFAVAGADVGQPLRLESDQFTSGNLPYLLTWVGMDPADPATAAALTGALVAALVAAAILIERPWRRPVAAVPLPVALSCLLLVFMLVSRKAYTSYLVMGLLPMTIAVASALPRFRQRAGFLAFCGLASVEPSLWFRWMGEGTLAGVRLVPFDAGAAFAGVQLVLLAGYAVLLRALARGAPVHPDAAGRRGQAT